MAALHRAAAAALMAGMACTGGAAQASPSYSPPGVYGRVDMRPYPAYSAAPAANSAPASAAAKSKGRAAAKTSPDTAFFWVPVGHRLQWAEYCKRYAACGLQVDFVSNEWYHHHGPGKGLGGGHDHDHDHEH